MTSKKKKYGLSTILACGFLAAFFVISAIPSPLATIGLVSANPGLKTETTKIKEVKVLAGYTPGVEKSYDTTVAIFTATGQTVTVEVGQLIEGVSCFVCIDKVYAATEALAESRTKVTAIIKNPAGSTIFNVELETVERTGTFNTIDYGTYWQTRKHTPVADIIDHDLVEGTYTITIKYEIYTA